ncbi:MAG: branched-chain amino acid aminotransferase [Tateyamaria sp.]|nr:branched-chain amino acid aminotransferase [Tateyamaria sp.]
MSIGTKIRTFFQGSWYDEDLAIMRAADQGSWVGTTVFDGARFFDGCIPDLDKHCARINKSAEALMITPIKGSDEILSIIHEGLRAYDPTDAVYIRPMYWAIDGDVSGIVPKKNSTGFAICLEAVPMINQDFSTTLGRTSFRRPVLEDNVVNAKAGCLYPNNARMLAEVRRNGYGNALVADAMGNVAESATANIFMVKDGSVYTPIPNGTFLSGITRARHIDNMRIDGMDVQETILTFDDFANADEVFLSGNMTKITPVTGFESKSFPIGPVTRRVREMYWDWAKTETFV